MNKHQHHPANRAERMKLKAKKDTFVSKTDRASHVRRKLEREELETKELDDALKEEVR